jgi:hypothetical protein
MTLIAATAAKQAIGLIGFCPFLLDLRRGFRLFAGLYCNKKVATKGDLIMNTTTSTVFHSGALIPHRTHRAVNNHSRTLFAKLSAIAEGFVDELDRAASGGPEKFYQDHVTAIFMALYAEVALGPFMGALMVYLYSH